jgi:hypothetical protein
MKESWFQFLSTEYFSWNGEFYNTSNTKSVSDKIFCYQAFRREFLSRMTFDLNMPKHGMAAEIASSVQRLATG